MIMKTVWIADDDPYYHEDMKDYLEAKGFKVLSFFTAVALLAALETATEARKVEGEEQQIPDVIVVDMMMPYDDTPEQQTMPPDLTDPERVTGVRLTRELVNRSGWKVENTVSITAFDDANLHATLATIGIPKDQILLKPSPANKILKAIERASSKR